MYNEQFLFDMVGYEASRPNTSWHIGVPVISPRTGEEATKSEMQMAEIFCKVDQKYKKEQQAQEGD